MVWTGSFVAPVTGTYYFQTYSDDGSNVYIDGTLALDNGFYGGGHGMQNGTIYPIVLTAGTTHTIQVLWVQGGGGWGINATWQVTPSGGSQTASAYLTDSSGSYTLGLYTNP
jgi:hypothetical protein